VPIVLKSGNLNLLEPSGPVQACNGIALPFTCSQNWVPRFESFPAVLQVTLVSLLLCSGVELLRHALTLSVAKHDSVACGRWHCLDNQNVVNENSEIISVELMSTI